MHRTIEIALAGNGTDRLVDALAENEHVIGVSVQRGASVKPPGDVVVVQTLNRGADAVMRAVAEARRHGPVSVATAELASLSDVEHQSAIDNDVDEAIWEELETGLRHQGRVSPNYLTLMALGGALAGAGLLAVDEPALQMTAAVAAAVIAPGFEPLAKVPLGVVLQRLEVVRRGIYSTLAGYAVLLVGAALAYGVLSVLGVAPDATTFADSSAVKHIAEPSWPDLLISAGGALSGVVIQSAFRRSVIAGALIAMRMIDAAALVGVALMLERLDLAGHGLSRLGIDVLLVAAAGALVFGLKQVFVHKRAPLR